MAKINVPSRPGALSELLKRKGMTKTDARQKTRLDPKTLLKIDRGEEVKLETLQQVANKLEVTEEYFRPPPAAEATNNIDVPERGTIMLRKLDVARLFELLSVTDNLLDCLEWKLNTHVRDDEARRFLKDFEKAVENLWKERYRDRKTVFSGPCHTLEAQLDRLKLVDDMAACLEQFAVHRLVLLGSSYLVWMCSGKYEGSSKIEYLSFNTVLLSVEPFGTQSRRAHIIAGDVPPTSPEPLSIPVFVNGLQLPHWGSCETNNDTG
jgi:transcriptional regulator with XRE-family HTH domain